MIRPEDATAVLPPDWMDDSPEKTALAGQVSDLIELLQPLLP
jgi:hypothetical protein